MINDINNKPIKLHGGPMHGKSIMLPMETRTMKVSAPLKNKENSDPEKPIPVVYGSYSQVGESTRQGMWEFEWDGWLPR